MQKASSRPLVVVLATPPLTSGERTLKRVELAAQQLGHVHPIVINLVNWPTQDITDLSRMIIPMSSWLQSRIDIEASLASKPEVLLAFGTTLPTGAMREPYQTQLSWLLTALETAKITEVITLGGRPSHPSRWQRHTSRAHPDLDFADALSRSYVRSDPAVHLLHPRPHSPQAAVSSPPISATSSATDKLMQHESAMEE